MSREFIQSLEDRRLLSASLSNGIVTITGGSSVDNIAITKNTTSLLVKQNGATKSFKLAAVVKIVVNAGAGNDTINVAADITKPASVNGQDGNDTISGGGGNDTLNGGNGVDKIKGNRGADTEIGGAGDDNLDGGEGNDNLQGGDGNDTETGDAGDDKLDGGNGNDRLFGGSGNDNATGGAGDDTEAGEDGNDNLDGGDNNDTLDGGAGDDDLAGKAGVNTLKGGDGRDTFVSGSGSDFIADHDEAEDDGEDPGTEHPEEGRISFGTVTAVSDTSITISVLGDKGAVSTKTFMIDGNTVITANDQPVKATDLPIGLKVFIAVNPAAPTLATNIVAVAASTEGKVSSVNTTLNTITLAGKDGKPARTFTVAANAKITVNNVPATLADITAGAQVKLQLWALDPTVAVGIRAEANEGGGGDGGGGVHDHKAAGAVVSTDTTANTITITGEPGGPNRTFTLAAGATITVDGVATPLGSLPAGLKVVLTLNEATPPLVTSIVAAGRVVEGKVSAVDLVAGTLTLAGHEGLPPTTYTIPATAKITLNGAAVTLDKITVGTEVRIQLSAMDGSVLAVSAKSEDGNDEGDEGRGAIVSVDTLNSKITLSVQKEGQAAQQVTFSVAPTAKIKLDGQLVTLDKLTAGLKAEFVTSPADPTVLIEIDAESKRVSGKVASVNTAASTITLVGHEGQPGQTFTVAAGATIKLNDAVTTLDKIPAGASVVLTLSAIDNTATAIVASAGVGGGPH